MTRRRWFWALAHMSGLVVVIAFFALGFAQRCSVLEQGAIGFGCEDMTTFVPTWSFLVYFLVGASIVTAAGLGVTFALGRRPTRRSVAVWISAGVLGFGFVSYFFVSRSLATPLAVVIAVAAVIAITAGVSLARPQEGDADRAGS